MNECEYCAKNRDKLNCPKLYERTCDRFVKGEQSHQTAEVSPSNSSDLLKCNCNKDLCDPQLQHRAGRNKHVECGWCGKRTGYWKSDGKAIEQWNKIAAL